MRGIEWRGDDLRDFPRVGGDGRADRPLGVRSHVGPGVESAAGGPFVDPFESDLTRLVHAAGVLTGHLDLVCHRRAIHAAVGQPAGRPSGTPAPPRRSLGPGGRLQQPLQIDVLVQLLQLAVALLAYCVLERFAK